MTRKLIAAVALAVLLLPTPAWAQTPPTTTVLCDGMPTEVAYTRETWEALPEARRTIVCAVRRQEIFTAQLVATRERILAEGQAERDAVRRQQAEAALRQPYSKPLGITGVVMAFAGVALLLPAGKTVHVLGDDFCVTDYSVDYGGCGPGMDRATVGLMLLGSGIALGWLGLHDVDVKPLVAPGTKGAAATVKWGKKGK